MNLLIELRINRDCSRTAKYSQCLLNEYNPLDRSLHWAGRSLHQGDLSDCLGEEWMRSMRRPSLPRTVASSASETCPSSGQPEPESQRPKERPSSVSSYSDPLTLRSPASRPSGRATKRWLFCHRVSHIPAATDEALPFAGRDPIPVSRSLRLENRDYNFIGL